MLKKIMPLVFGRPPKKTSEVLVTRESGSPVAPAVATLLVRVNDVFSTTVIAPLSYIDRSKDSAEKTTRDRIRQLSTALRQDGMIVGIYGESKSGKTMFARRTLSEAGYRFIIAESSEVRSLDGFWRHVAEKLQLYVETGLTLSEEDRVQSGAQAELAGRVGLGAIRMDAVLEAASETSKLRAIEIKGDVLNSVRQACLDFLGRAKMAVIIDDFHDITDDHLRAQIVANVKMPAGQMQGKFVFVAIPEETLFVGQTDEQLIGRNGIFEFPLWHRDDLKEIARKGFRVLNVDLDDRHALYIERSSFSNPINVQQICINICSVCGFLGTDGIPSGYQVSNDNIKVALGDFAVGFKRFEDILRQAEKAGGEAAAERKYKVQGVSMNVYELVFVALCSGGAVNPKGILRKTIRDRIRRILKNEQWYIGNLGEVLQRLANANVVLDYAKGKTSSAGGSHPLLYKADEEKLYVVNPILRMYLLWGYLRNKGIDIDAILRESATDEA